MGVPSGTVCRAGVCRRFWMLALFILAMLHSRDGRAGKLE